ncbi:hypothetical protein OE88DRAFT_468710 [Heliocybe sulcata]|uniref:Uncharacterized protein n=1 Tax=Heliocybe sulcata TaxID=5364 RepID=A0A5C3MVW4_9AGAM|nr:hypothetical protein OE88DRAFT_468710 [Heliocybe sulcata]
MNDFDLCISGQEGVAPREGLYNAVDTAFKIELVMTYEDDFYHKSTSTCDAPIAGGRRPSTRSTYCQIGPGISDTSVLWETDAHNKSEALEVAAAETSLRAELPFKVLTQTDDLSSCFKRGCPDPDWRDCQKEHTDISSIHQKLESYSPRDQAGWWRCCT